MTKTIHGIVHGKTIELDEDLGVAEGQEVEVQVKVVPPVRTWGEGIRARRAAGPTTRRWMPSWSKFTRTESLNVGLKWRSE